MARRHGDGSDGGHRSGIVALSAVLLAAGACGAEPAPTAADTPPPGDPDAQLGGFVVDLVAQRGDTAAHTAVLGKVYDGTMPAALVWNVAAEADGCRLLTPRVPFCSPGCGGTAACAEDGLCVTYPKAQNVGRVQVSGLGGSVFGMDPIGGSYQPAAGVSLPYPPFSEGATVAVDAAGGATIGAFSLASRGIAPLQVPGSFTLADGQPLPVAWTPPADPGGTRIEVRLDISHHGGTKGKIECDTADQGALTIPAAQVSQLLALGVAGFPTIVVSRVAASVAATPQGRVTLRVVSGLELEVEIPGLRSCTGSEDCPTGQICQSDQQCK
jgi:hypothetical protein